jgi:hypothetical protein
MTIRDMPMMETTEDIFGNLFILLDGSLNLRNIPLKASVMD